MELNFIIVVLFSYVYIFKNTLITYLIRERRRDYIERIDRHHRNTLGFPLRRNVESDVQRGFESSSAAAGSMLCILVGAGLLPIE